MSAQATMQKVGTATTIKRTPLSSVGTASSVEETPIMTNAYKMVDSIKLALDELV